MASVKKNPRAGTFKAPGFNFDPNIIPEMFRVQPNFTIYTISLKMINITATNTGCYFVIDYFSG